MIRARFRVMFSARARANARIRSSDRAGVKSRFQVRFRATAKFSAMSILALGLRLWLVLGLVSWLWFCLV
jgi:hypothetical protein